MAQTRYPLRPARVRELAGALRRATTASTSSAAAAAPTSRISSAATPCCAGWPRPGRSGRVAKPRTHHWMPSVASLYSQVPLRQENAYLSIGERCNANGSKKWRELQEAHDWDGCVEMARDQVKEGSHALDVCTAFVGRDESRRHERGRHAASPARSPPAGDRFDRVRRCSSGAQARMAASRSSTRSTSRTARSRPRSA